MEPAIATAMTTNLASLQEIVLNLERVCNTPLPFAYQVHLRMTLWYVRAYLLILSFRSTGVFYQQAVSHFSTRQFNLLLSFLNL